MWSPVDIGLDGSSFRVDMFSGDNYDEQLTVEVDILTNFWTAVDWAKDYLASFDNHLHEVFDLSKALDWAPLKGHLSIPPKRKGGQMLLVRNNILIK